MPPVDLWDPPLCGDMDLVIRRNGDWVHCGGVIKRGELVRLFAKVLKREGDDWFLVTPAEKWRIRVEDAPLFITAVQFERRDNQQALIFESSTGDVVVASDLHSIRVVEDPVSREPSPYLLVRRNLEGLIARSVFYQMVEHAEERIVGGQTWLGLESMGTFFPLGRPE